MFIALITIVAVNEISHKPEALKCSQQPSSQVERRDRIIQLCAIKHGQTDGINQKTQSRGTYLNNGGKEKADKLHHQYPVSLKPVTRQHYGIVILTNTESSSCAIVLKNAIVFVSGTDGLRLDFSLIHSNFNSSEHKVDAVN